MTLNGKRRSFPHHGPPGGTSEVSPLEGWSRPALGPKATASPLGAIGARARRLRCLVLLAPKARLHLSLGQRPRNRTPVKRSALKARIISRSDSHEARFQRSLLLNQSPGALPQAVMKPRPWCSCHDFAEEVQDRFRTTHPSTESVITCQCRRAAYARPM